MRQAFLPEEGLQARRHPLRFVAHRQQDGHVLVDGLDVDRRAAHQAQVGDEMDGAGHRGRGSGVGRSAQHAPGQGRPDHSTHMYGTAMTPIAIPP